MSNYTFRAVSKTVREKGKKVTGKALDDYFGKHQYGYRVKGKKRVYNQEQFDKYYEMQELEAKD